MGNDFLRIRKGGNIQTFGTMGKIQMSKEKPIKLSTTYLVLFTESFITARNWLSWLLHGMGKVWHPKFELEKPWVFGKCILTPRASKNPKTFSHSNMLSRFHFFLTIFLHVRLLETFVLCEKKILCFEKCTLVMYKFMWMLCN